MAGKVALSLVIGGAVASSLGAAFKTAESGIQKLEAKGNKAKVLKSTIGETIKLREEWKRAHDSGAAGADKLQRKLDSNLDALRKQGIEVGRLGREYQRLGREAKAADLQLKGHQQLQAGKESLKSNIGRAVVATGAAAVPTMISANYQAIIRDIAIKADIANKPEEQQLSRTVIDTAKDTGMSRNDVADLVNQLVGAGMELDKALSYAPVAAKFAVGQGASGVDTASMIQALEQNAKISDPKVMQQALEAIAYQGQAGSFEASDMAKWFPQLLAGMEKNGITGLDAVTSLGSMLQVQMKTAGSSDEAANNFKNWMEKIGAGDIKKAYSDVGIDYQASLNTGLQKGMNVIEASMALAMRYVEKTDPAKAKQIKDAQAKIDKEVDPEKAKAALEALEKTLRTGDIFADMQVKAALTAYGQNRGLYEELKADSKKASGILDKNLAERRETSAQQWAELGQAVDDSMRSIGDAIRPATDLAAQGLTKVARGITSLSDQFPSIAMGIGGITAAVIAFLSARSALRVGRGVFNIAMGRGLEGLAGRAGKAERAPIKLPKTGSKVVDTGLGLLGKVFSSGSKAPGQVDDLGAAANDTQRVFVVNADAIGGIGRSVANSAPAGPARGSRRSRRRERRRAARQGTAVRPAPAVEAPKLPKAAVAKVRPVPAALSALTATDDLGKVARSVRGVSRLAKNLPGGNIIDAGAAAIDVALNAETKDEKAEGYGGAAGSLAGTLAGAAAGAAIGSVVPVIGTAVGGAVGAVLGGMGGESFGGWLGKRWFGDEPADGQAEPESPPALGEALRVTMMPAKEVEPEPAMPPAQPEPASTPKAQPEPSMPKLGDTVREVATPAPMESPVSYDPREAGSKDPFLLPALTAGKVRFPGSGLVRPPDQPEPPAVPEPLPQAYAPKLGDTVGGAVTPARVEPAVSYDPHDPASKDPFLLPALTAKKVRFPGAGLVRPQAESEPGREPPAPNLGAAVQKAAPVPAKPEVSYDPRDPASNDPFLLPALMATKVRFPGADLVRPQPQVQPPGGLGDVVREMAKVAPPAPKLPEVRPPAKDSPPPAPKVDQAFTFAPVMPIHVTGDVKDPNQLLREMESGVRGLFDAWQREISARMASSQLFDQPHV
ncbi:phage tail tape measure protein [Pseudomonas sp. p99-361]|uniref:phage tail tape measure protein n=1 Tax=Pseudomonas sp. p99-361 TaxID=2479852 RepID=UPI000F77522C|nr:phage tail tape measure protein [Pseudomonas sp. p99-361]RRV72489.1 phage tail tape measure protein [Pseudomonas sp. p99-361]